MKRLAIFLAAVLMVSPACSNKKGALGAGGPVNFCIGWYIYSELEEPPPDDASEVDAYAAAWVRVIDRIKLNFRVDLPKGPALVIPSSVGDDLKTIRARMVRLRTEVKEARGDAGKVRQAVNNMADDGSLIGADNRLVDFASTRCPE